MDGSATTNPDLVGYRYALLWYTLADSQPDADSLEDKWQRDLTHWAAVRGLQEEEFYLHTALPTQKCPVPSRTRACRLNNRWGRYGSAWYGNPGNPRFIQYTRSRARRIVAETHSRESIFWDTMSSGDLYSHACGPKMPTLEYGDSCDLYQRHLVELVIRVREALGRKPQQVNTASYTSIVSPYNGWVAVAAGSVHTEGLNTPFREYEGSWGFVDDLLNAGVKVAFAANWYLHENDLIKLGAWEHWKTQYTGGNYGSGLRRYRMTTLAQHYLLTPARLDGNFYWNPNPQDWAVAYSKQWIPAFEVDLGSPIDAFRVLLATGVDGTGQNYDLFRRKFSHAWVFVRPMKKSANTSWDDSTAIAVPLPEDGLSLLTPDGTAVPLYGNRLWLRNGEGVILLRPSSRTLDTLPR